AVSSDWDDAGNWDIRVPTACDHVVIPEVGDEPEIAGTTAAVAKSVTIEEEAYLTIESGGSLEVDGADGDGITIIGEIYNNGTINIGQSLGVGGNGVKVNPSGTFYNDFNSVLNIDNTSSRAIYNTNIFSNSGILNIGQINQTNSIGNHAIHNDNTFTNEAGEINIDRILSNRKAILNNSGTFTNKAIIHIGANTEAGSEGIENRASFNNDAGEINIDRTSERGILNKGTFTNSATINIGANASVGSFGIEIKALPTGSFINEAGEINIDRSTFDGLSIPSGVFRNRANINIGCNSNTISTGLYCDGPFINESGELIIKNTTSRALQVTSGTSIINKACASIRLFDNMIVGNAENDGFFSVDAADNSQVFFFENNGILEDVQGTVPTDIAGFENNEIIIAPTQASNCGAVASAFDLGAMVDFDILGIFTDENATASAGAYDASNNTFTPTNVLTIGNNSFYVKIEDSGNGCEFIAEWTVEATVADVTWTGAVSSDWDDAGNWDIRVPTACDHVVIPDTNNDPIILEGTSAVAKSVEIASGAVLTLNAGSSLTIDGADANGISNNGVINNSGTITIDNTGSNAYYSNNNGAACFNSGQFDIGQNEVAADINGIGIFINKGTFDNLANGVVNIDNTSLDGMFTDDLDNSGTINIGLNGGNIGDDGLHQYGGTVVNTGTLVINGTAAQAYHNDGTLDNSGMLKGTGIFSLNDNALGGMLAPGLSTGKMTFVSDQAFQATQTMEIEVEGTTPETQHDMVEVNGTATISGTLAVSISYTPSSNDRIVFLEATTVSGSFSVISPSLPTGWAVDYSVPGEVALQFNVSLPVELVYFSATKKEDEVELTWQTASETNNEGFEVEHSTDGRDWDYLGFVDGHGNSTEAHDYSFQHQSPSSGINYYRLRQVDFDGQWEYSKVCSVEFDSPSVQIKVFPNPAVHYATLSLPNFSSEALVQVIAPDGRIMKQMNIREGEQQVRLDVQTWPAGVYFIQLRLDGQNYTQRLIHNKL
ncbi:MAG: T9SS type A sorting domain-containing protein, partial [Bacteroidota bacterium]